MNKPSLKTIFLLLMLLFSCKREDVHTIVIVSSDAEWSAFKSILKRSDHGLLQSPYGEYFYGDSSMPTGLQEKTMFMHGGWGKVDSAASTQWAIMGFHPRRIVNLGTAGGFPGRIKEGDIVFVTKTVIYDIVDRMGDNEESIQEYTTVINTEIPPQLTAYVIPSAILSADQDIDPNRLPALMKKYDAVAGDWESGSIARVCQRNGVQLYILRGISDIVTPTGSRAYGNIDDFRNQAKRILERLLFLMQFLPEA